MLIDAEVHGPLNLSFADVSPAQMQDPVAHMTVLCGCLMARLAGLFTQVPPFAA